MAKRIHQEYITMADGRPTGKIRSNQPYTVIARLVKYEEIKTRKRELINRCRRTSSLSGNEAEFGYYRRIFNDTK